MEILLFLGRKQIISKVNILPTPAEKEYGLLTISAKGIFFKKGTLLPPKSSFRDLANTLPSAKSEYSLLATSV